MKPKVRFNHISLWAFLWVIPNSLFLIPNSSNAQQILLDEEFTQAATTLTAPLRANLAPQIAVQFVIVNNNSINAFVTPENIIYVHSGLIAKANSAAELQGVLAHELGHIASNHLFQQEVNAKQATMGALGAAALGLGAAVAGAPQAATAIALGGQAGAMQAFMAHTRTQEAEADRRAINALHTAGLSAQGMVEMFETLRTESQLSYDAPPPWLVTHPLPPERLATLTEAVTAENAQLKSGLKKSETAIDFPRLQAKVMALTSTPGSVLRKYGNSPGDLSRYALALAYFKQGKLEFAYASLLPLLKEHPQDPFYRELEAKIALEHSDLGTANRVLTKVAEAHPNYLLIQYQLAEVLRNQNDFQGALTRYERITRAWPEWSDPWMGLGLVYGNLGRLTESHLARTQGFIVAPDKEGAKQSLLLAKDYLRKTPNPNLQDWANTLQSRLDAMK